MCKRFQFDHRTICPGEWDAQEFWDTNGSPNFGQTIKPYNNPKKKKKKKKKITCRIVDFAVPADHRVKLKESEKKDKYLDLFKELKKLWNIKETIIPIVIGALGAVTKELVQGLEDLEITGYPNYNIVEIGQNTEKNPGDLRRLAVTQTPVKDHQLVLMWKTL